MLASAALFPFAFYLFTSKLCRVLVRKAVRALACSIPHLLNLRMIFMKPYPKALCLLLAFVFAAAPFQFAVHAATGVDFYDEPGVRLLNQPVSEYRSRRQKLMSEIKDGVVVVLGNVEEDAGIEARYRQNNWMAYLTGVRTPGASLLLVPQGLASLG